MSSKEQDKKILTHFIQYHEDIFQNGRLKLGCTQNFNDDFDSKLLLHDDKIAELAQRFGIEESVIKYWIAVLQFVQTISFSSKSAIDMQASNMWGLYANKGEGLAFEFDYDELEQRANCTKVKEFRDICCNENENAVKNYTRDNPEILTQLKCLLSICDTTDQSQQKYMIKYNQDDLCDLIDAVKNKKCLDNLAEPSAKYLYQIKYNNDFNCALNIFKELLELQPTRGTKPDVERVWGLTCQFITTKTINWKHEHEYRLLHHKLAISVMRQYGKQQKNNKMIENMQNEFNEKAKDEYMQFSSKNPWEHDIDTNALAMFLPYPKSIYLGTKFPCYTDNDAPTEKFETVKNFCERHSVKLYKMESTADYERNQYHYKTYNFASNQFEDVNEL